ncbi:MAG: NifU family protein [Ruminococcus sp.]|nr:NifU family protein [Ruminococcus sp.]
MNDEEKIIKIKELLDDIRPLLNQDGGDVEFIKFEDNFVYIRLTGACLHCGFQDDTINYGIEAYIKEQVPIEGVINVPL